MTLWILLLLALAAGGMFIAACFAWYPTSQKALCPKCRRAMVYHRGVAFCPARYNGRHRRAFAMTATLLLVAMTMPALGQSKKALTVGEALTMLQAFRNLDGRVVVVKQNGVDTSVTTPWDFGSGTFRMKIAKNVAALVAVEQQVEDTRQKIVAEIQSRLPVGKNGEASAIAQGTPEYEAFSKQINDMLKQPAQVTLSRIKVSELKLDKNEIPVTVLAALDPILDE